MKNIDPSVKKFFPWALFLALALMFSILAARTARSEGDVWACYGSARYQAMSSEWPQCNKPGGRLAAFCQAHPKARKCR
jgi:hypothetical protein